MKKSTVQAEKLYKALRDRNIFCKLEDWDGDKHIDISIPWAKIDIEVDGLYHFFEPKQIIADFDRSYWSIINDNYDTIHIPNFIIDNYLDRVADAITEYSK